MNRALERPFGVGAERAKESEGKVGRYLLLKELGQGSVGKVCLAHDPFIDRDVAIKTAFPPMNGNLNWEQFQQLFFNEARAAGKLSHPHIVALYDAIVEDDIYHLIMEYVPGTTCKTYCRTDPLCPLDKAVKIIFHCAKALDYAHENGVVHRDIKPSNILVSDEWDAKISDFSISFVEGLSNLTPTGSFTGSTFYASPEQVREESLTARSDIFSLGCVMYELLTGAKPFMAETDVAVFYKILHEDPVPLLKNRPDLPEVLGKIVTRALAKNPEERYKSGAELASELSEAFDKIRLLDQQIEFQEKLGALKKLNFFREFSLTELNEVLHSTQWHEYEPGSPVITEGEIDDSFYIIVMGGVMVKKGEKPIAKLKPGDCFGEMAYLGQIKRTASIQAISKSILMKVNASIIQATSHNTQLLFFKVFSETLIRRLTQTNRLLASLTS